MNNAEERENEFDEGTTDTQMWQGRNLYGISSSLNPSSLSRAQANSISPNQAFDDQVVLTLGEHTTVLKSQDNRGEELTSEEIYSPKIVQQPLYF